MTHLSPQTDVMASLESDSRLLYVSCEICMSLLTHLLPQTDVIVSLESDLRRTVQDRDALRQSLHDVKESAAVSEVQIFGSQLCSHCGY